MSKSWIRQNFLIWMSVTLVVPLLSISPCPAQPSPSDDRSSEETRNSRTTVEEAKLRFSFAATPWREVIDWLAEEGNLALHVDGLPTGSFTYSDPDLFTHQGAIDRVNLFLLPQGFTIVRSGKLLSVINLNDPRSMQQLDALAEFVQLDELREREKHDVVKCIFPLGELEAEDAVQELSALNLMTSPAVFAKTNQLMITDTAAKLRNVKTILDSFQPSQMDNGTVVKSFALQHVDAEDVLVVARPHLGLAVGEMIGIDVSLSADVHGKNIFVTGIEDKVTLIEGLIEAIDQPTGSITAAGGEMRLQSHLVEGGNVEIVYNVLQTLLAGETVRLSMDETASAVVALASPEVQSQIEQTVAELQAAEAEFEVIPLKNIDPYFAISLLEEMLDLPDAYDDPEEIDPDAPKIDADPGNMRLYVRAKNHQIEQIKKIVQGLDESGGGDSGDQLRILPFRGEQAERIVETAAKFWRGANPVILFRSGEQLETETERVVTPQEPAEKTLTGTGNPAAHSKQGQRWLTANFATDAPAIRCQVTARGLLLQCDQSDALDRFEDHVRAIAGPTDSIPSPPIVFYLKYTKAVNAIRLLAELLDGGDAANEFEGGTLVNGYVSSGSSILGTLVTSRDGTTTLTSGSMTVLADPRLNRLIAQGTAGDIERIENYLKIVDKDNSITSIETYGTSRVIELFNTKASEVAAAIRDAYAGRIATGGGAAALSQPGSPEQQREAAAAKLAEAKAEAKEAQQQANGKKTAAAMPSSRAPQSFEPKMTIAVHEPSNSLIVTAPEQLFLEVERLAKSIDSRGQQIVEVVAPLNGELFELVLQQVLLGQADSARPTAPSSSRSPTPTPSPTSRMKNER